MLIVNYDSPIEEIVLNLEGLLGWGGGLCLKPKEFSYRVSLQVCVLVVDCVCCDGGACRPPVPPPARAVGRPRPL